MTDEGDLVEDAVEPPTTAFSPLLIMQQDAIDAVAKKIESLPPSQSAATDGADNAEAKREPVPANQGAATHGADNAKGKGKAAGGAASSSGGPEEADEEKEEAMAEDTEMAEVFMKTQAGTGKRARNLLLSPHSAGKSAKTEEEKAAIREIVRRDNEEAADLVMPREFL